MPEALLALDGWLLRTTLAGGVVLLIGTLWMALTRQPVQRQRLGEFALMAALLVALPAALPSWWSLPGTQTKSATSKALFGQPVSANRTHQPDVTQDLVVAADNQEQEEIYPELTEILGLIKTVCSDDKEEMDATSAIVIPPDNASDNQTTKGAMEPLSTFLGTWAIRLVGLAYFGLMIVLLIRCSMGYYGLWRYWRHRRPAPAHVHAALAELEPDPSRRPRIGVNTLVHGPVSYGLWKPTILLPPAFCNEGDPEKLRWILAHELTHLRRRDAWSCLLLALSGALYFHVPWFWWMKRHVRLAQEYLADAAAAQFSSAVEYAQYLVSLTALSSRPTLASSRAAGVFESPSDLYRRVHMLLHQRNVIERGAPRWWTLTAAASFLALAACTAGINLHADEPEKKKEVTVTVVTDDDGKDTDKKKKTETRTIRVNGKVVEGGDGKVLLWKADDDQDKQGTFKWHFAIPQDKQKAIDEAMKKLEQVLEKLPKQVDADTRARLEELKKTLKSMKEEQHIHLQRAMESAKVAEGTARIKIQEAMKNSAEFRKAAEAKAAEAHKLAQVYREKALATEKEARAAQEKALSRWQSAKDGKDKDAAIRELEKAIADKEQALRELKNVDKADAPKVAQNLSRFMVRPELSSAKGRLGVVVAEIDANVRGHLDLAEGQGLMIQEVIDPSPAWNNGNGLRSSDILVELAGKKVPSNQDQFREMVNKLGEGTYNAVVFRKGKRLTINGIKLPAADKAKKVVLEGQFSPDAHQLADAAVLVEGFNFDPKQLNEKVMALDLARVNLDKANLALKDPVRGSIKVDSNLILAQPLKREHAVNLLEVQPLQPPHIDGKALVPKVLAVKEVPVVSTAVKAQGQAASKPRLGVTLEVVPEAVAAQIELPENRGLFVREVADGSAAQKAGILKNDILIEFADKPVSNDHPAFTQFIKELKPGKYTATVIRKGKEIRIRDINLADPKVAADERKAKAREWTVEGDSDKSQDKDEAKARAKDSFKKPKDDFFPNANRGLNFARARGNTSISINNDQFTATSSEDGKTITMSGKIVNGKAEPKSITIKTEDGEKKYKSVKEVPEEDRASVEKILSSFKGNVFQWNGVNNAFFNKGLLDKQLEEQLKLFEKSMKQLEEDNPGFEQLEREMQRLREQLRKMRGSKDDDVNNNNN